MERFFKHILVLLETCCLVPLSSCQEGSEAGDLLGQWRMTGSDTHYLSFSGTVSLFMVINEGEVYGKFQHSGDSLFIQCVSIDGIRRDTTMVEETFGMKPFTNIRVKIEALNGDRLELSKGSQHWSFYKY